jgi:CO/xanthine dehydrogenase FAD-binding subunit
MRLRPFELIEPDSVAEAVAMSLGQEMARIASGGTALVPMIAFGLLRPDPLITLHVPGLAGVKVDDGTPHPARW